MVGDQTILLINTAWDPLFTRYVSHFPHCTSCFKLIL